MNPFALVNARTIAEATRTSATVAGLMAGSGGSPASDVSIVKAGGIDLLDLMKETLLSPDRILNLREIPGLDQIAVKVDGLRIGAMATLAALAGHPFVRDHFKILAHAAAASASPQIRNVATAGGNLLQRPRCWYFRAKEFHCLKKGGDHCFAHNGENRYHAVFDNDLCAIVHPSTIATVLMALGASVELVDARGMTRKVGLAEFFVSPSVDLTRENNIGNGEILTAVEVPSIRAESRCAWLKQGERDSADWPLADVAVVLDFDAEDKCARATIVLGAAAPAPRRARSAEALLVGRKIDGAVAMEAGRAALDGATPLARNSFKLPLVETLVRRAISQAAATPG